MGSCSGKNLESVSSEPSHDYHRPVHQQQPAQYGGHNKPARDPTQGLAYAKEAPPVTAPFGGGPPPQAYGSHGFAQPAYGGQGLAPPAYGSPPPAYGGQGPPAYGSQGHGPPPGYGRH